MKSNSPLDYYYNLQRAGGLGLKALYLHVIKWKTTPSLPH